MTEIVVTQAANIAHVRHFLAGLRPQPTPNEDIALLRGLAQENGCEADAVGDESIWIHGPTSSVVLVGEILFARDPAPTIIDPLGYEVIRSAAELRELLLENSGTSSVGAPHVLTDFQRIFEKEVPQATRLTNADDWNDHARGWRIASPVVEFRVFVNLEDREAWSYGAVSVSRQAVNGWIDTWPAEDRISESSAHVGDLLMIADIDRTSRLLESGMRRGVDPGGLRDAIFEIKDFMGKSGLA